MIDDRQTADALRDCKTWFLRSRNRAIFLFLCGGDDGDPRYVARGVMQKYLSTCEYGAGVVCVKPEAILTDYADKFDRLDLLVLEKLIAEVSDAILLFDESPGSLCELGAFSACDPICDVLTAFVPKRYKGAATFAMKGPVEHIQANRSPLSGVIYGDLACPLMSYDLIRYFASLRDSAKTRKKINDDPSKINVGAYCLELLDLASVLSPITVSDLEECYLSFKGFAEPLSFDSEGGLGPDSELVNTEMLVCFLAACGLLSYEDSAITMTGEHVRYFMFNQSKRRKIMKLRARLLASKRRGRRRCADVRFGSDG